MLENVTGVTDLCRHCLMCRHMCPVGNITRLETLTPHGWGQLVALERRGLSTWNERTVDALYACADCGSCRNHCVYGNPLPEGIVAARAALVERGLAPAAVHDVAERLRAWENPFEERRPEPSCGTGEYALFVGDEAGYLRPATLEAALALLRAVGIEPVLIGRGRSNGHLASSLGLVEIATSLARANVAELERTGATKLLVLSPGDAFTFSRLYDERLGVGLPAGVEVVQVVSLLAGELQEGRLRLLPANGAAPLAYVDPTHAARAAAALDAPRALLGALLAEPPRELFWRRERAYPAGDLALRYTHPRIADELTRARLADAVDAGARGVVTYAPGTLVELERLAPEFGLDVVGMYELLADHVAPVATEPVHQEG